MREIVSVQVGQCGVHMGANFWEAICGEHAIDPDGAFQGTSTTQLKNIDVYFDEAEDYSRFVPRSVFVDMDGAACDTVAAGAMGRLFCPDNFVRGSGGTGNNWAKGYRSAGAEILEDAMDVIRAEAEACDRLQGFQFTHSLGGGTGSGLGCLLLEQLTQEYPDRIFASYCVVPSPKTSDTVVEPYNALMGFSRLTEATGLTYVLDNEALYNVAVRTLKLSKPTYADLNGLISRTMSGTTCSLRFPGQLNCDLRKLAVNMVPFPRLHFFTVSFAPLYSPNSTHFRKLTVPVITKQAFDARNQMNAADPRKGKYLTCACMYRGLLSMHEIEQQLLDVKHARTGSSHHNFVDWVPDNVMASLCDIPPVGLKASATFVGNTTAVQSVWMRVADQFSAMYRKKAFLHWYTNEGMEESEFNEAESNLKDLISEYQQAEASSAEGAGEHDEHEGEEGYGSELDEAHTPKNKKGNGRAVSGAGDIPTRKSRK